MSDIAVVDDDIDLLNGDLYLTSGIEAVRQRLRQDLRMFLGEWFLDLDYGVPYFQDILVKNPNPQIVEGIIKIKILESPGVLELTAFSADINNASRQLTVDFTVRCFDGEIDFKEVLGVA